MKSFLYYILMALILVIGCTRKLHTERTENHTDNGAKHTVDSLNEVIKTVSEAYEDLLKQTSGTDVVFNCPPCDSGKVGGSGMPHIIVKPDGTKEFSGPIKGYKDNSSLEKRLSATRQSVIDSMSHLIRTDTVYQKADTVQVVKTVKSRFIPWWVWLVLGLAGLLWLREHLKVIKLL